MSPYFDPASRGDSEREDRLRASAARVEIRPSRRVAQLATRSLACPACEMPATIDQPCAWGTWLTCGFCGESAPTREYVRDQGWPRVDVLARLG